jgi:hypothetical protein
MLQRLAHSWIGQAMGLFGCIQLFSVLVCGAPADSPPDPRGPGTIRMAQRLRELAEGINVMNNPFQNAKRAELLRQAVDAERDPKRGHELLSAFANELLNAGRNEEALQQYTRWEQTLAQTDPADWKRNRLNALGNQALLAAHW